MTSETEIRIRDIEGSVGRLEEAHKLLRAEEGTMNNPADELLISAMINISHAITEYNEEIRRLEK
jgi:hypothetical protein